MAIPKFGTPNDVVSIEADYNTNTVELEDGLKKKHFTLNLTDTLRKTKRIYTDYGIAESTDNDNNSLGVVIDSATLTKEEEIAEPVYGATTNYQSGAEPQDNEKLTYCIGLLWLRTRYEIRLEGKGELPAVLTRGKIIAGSAESPALVLRSATSGANSPEIKITQNVYVRDSSQRKDNTDFWTWSATLEFWEENSTPDTSPLKSECELFDFTSEITDSWYKITREYRWSKDGFVELVETVEIYDDDETSTI